MGMVREESLLVEHPYVTSVIERVHCSLKPPAINFYVAPAHGNESREQLRQRIAGLSGHVCPCLQRQGTGMENTRVKLHEGVTVYFGCVPAEAIHAVKCVVQFRPNFQNLR